MPVVPLNRRFFEWNEKEPSDPEFRRAMGLEEAASESDLERRYESLGIEEDAFANRAGGSRSPTPSNDR